jgi:hypothetical protein
MVSKPTLTVFYKRLICWRDAMPSRRAKPLPHAQFPGRAIVVPRHRTLSTGVARAIAKAAGWEA